MTYCSRCGVLLDPQAQACPLCTTPVQFPPEITPTHVPPYPRVTIPESMKKMMVWVVLTTIFTIAALSLIVINYLQSTVECWWTYPVMSIIFAWVYTTITVFLIRKRWIASSGWIISTIIFLAILNQLNAGSGWFWPLAFPLTILSGSVLMGIVAAITHARSVSFILAIILAESAIECIGIDYIINRFLGHLHIGWSLIALTIIIPVEILLLFYYSYLRKHIDLRRYFHV